MNGTKPVSSADPLISKAVAHQQRLKEARDRLIHIVKKSLPPPSTRVTRLKPIHEHKSVTPSPPPLCESDEDEGPPECPSPPFVYVRSRRHTQTGEKK